jgi:hypothetical protein
MVTRRRSEGIGLPGVDRTSAWIGPAAAAGSSGRPHPPQNREPGGDSRPQAGQTLARLRPQDPQ